MFPSCRDLRSRWTQTLDCLLQLQDFGICKVFWLKLLCYLPVLLRLLSQFVRRCEHTCYIENFAQLVRLVYPGQLWNVLVVYQCMFIFDLLVQPRHFFLHCFLDAVSQFIVLFFGCVEQFQLLDEVNFLFLGVPPEFLSDTLLQIGEVATASPIAAAIRIAMTDLVDGRLVELPPVWLINTKLGHCQFQIGNNLLLLLLICFIHI